MELKFLPLGRMEYSKALEKQYEILEQRQGNKTLDTLILVEHPPVITLGRQAMYENIVASESYIRDQGIDIHHTNRGGDVTYHGIGQIVGYPIVNLKEKGMGIREFVRKLEEVFIELLKNEFNITAGRDLKHTGVWVEDKKIVAIGLAVKQGITMHGFAFNVNSNLDHFKLIIPCGIMNKGVTSLEQILGKSVELDKVNTMVYEYFKKELNYNSYSTV